MLSPRVVTETRPCAGHTGVSGTETLGSAGGKMRTGTKGFVFDKEDGALSASGRHTIFEAKTQRDKAATKF